MRITWVVTLLALSVLSSCGEETLEPGQEGAWCRIGAFPCDPGLSCHQGGCYPGTPNPEAPRIGVRFDFAREGERTDDPGLLADGRDEIVLRVEVVDLDRGEPFTEPVRLRLNPRPAGQLGSTLLVLDEKGVATTTLRACNGAADDCPTRLLVQASTAISPMRGIGQTHSIPLEGGNPEAPGPMYGGGPIPGDQVVFPTGWNLGVVVSGSSQAYGGGSPGGGGRLSGSGGYRRKEACLDLRTYWFNDHPNNFKVVGKRRAQLRGRSASVSLRYEYNDRRGDGPSISVSGISGTGRYTLSSETRLSFSSPISGRRTLTNGSVSIAASRNSLSIHWSGTDSQGHLRGCVHVDR